MRKYFRSVINESKRVQWPNKEELRNMTTTVLMFSAIFAVIFLLMDFVIALILEGIR